MGLADGDASETAPPGAADAGAAATAGVVGPELGLAPYAVPHASTAKARRATNNPKPAQRMRALDLVEGFCPSGLMLSDRIVATGIPRVAASDSTHSHPAPSKQTVFPDCLFCVDRTGGFKPTD